MPGPSLKPFEDTDTRVRYDAGVFTESDWPVQLLVTLTYTDEYDKEWAEDGKYHVEVAAVASTALTPDKVEACKKSEGFYDEDWDALLDLRKASALRDYGTHAVLWQQQGHNRLTLLNAARKELGLIRVLFGFYMDRKQNAVGATGWDTIRGSYTPLPDEEEVA